MEDFYTIKSASGRFAAKIVEEHDPVSPVEYKDDSGEAGYWVLQHNRYDLPKDFDIDFDDFDGWEAIGEEVATRADLNDPVIKYVRWYEHSGVVINLVDSPDIGGFDAGCAGVVVYERENELFATSLFQEYAAYIEGDVWGVQIELDGEEIDSTYGFYGYDNARRYSEDEINSLDAMTDIEIKRQFGRTPSVKASAVHR